MGPRQVGWTCAAGLFIAGGYLCYFSTKESVPRPVAYAFGCAAGTSLGMLWGVLVYGEYRGASRRQRALLVLAAVLYASAISLTALSML
eukprot:6094377-Prymnesium_polylepis.1